MDLPQSTKSSNPIRPCPFTEYGNLGTQNGTILENDSLLAQFGQRFSELHGPLSLAVCFFGIPTNLANIIVLTRSSMAQSATNHLLFWLAVADLFTMLLYVPALYHFYIVRPNPIRTPVFSPYKSWVIYQTAAASGLIIFHSLAMWITVVLAVFRYLFIGFPTVGPRLATKQRALLSVLVLTLCCILFVIPNTMINFVDQCYGPKWKKNLSTSNETTSDKYDIYFSVGFEYPEDNGEKTEPVWRKKELYAINTWLQASLFKIIPCCLLSVLTVLLVFEMKRAIKRRQALQHTAAKKHLQKLLKDNQKDERFQQHSENRTTTLLLAILLSVLIVELPQGILVLCLQLIENFYVNVYQHLGDFIDFTTLVNESMNFVIYTSMSQQFRQEFCHVFFIDKLRSFIKRKYRGSPSNQRNLDLRAKVGNRCPAGIPKSEQQDFSCVSDVLSDNDQHIKF